MASVPVDKTRAPALRSWLPHDVAVVGKDLYECLADASSDEWELTLVVRLAICMSIVQRA